MTQSNGKSTKRAYVLLSLVLNIIVLLFVGQIFIPKFTGFILSTLWYILLILVVLFMSLGAFVLLGMKQEVGNILDMLVEGSLSVFDFLELTKKIFERFMMELKEFLVFLSPVLAYLVVFFLYLILLVFYKYFGQANDVTWLTVVLTIMLVSVVALFNLPGTDAKAMTGYLSRFISGFKQAFGDGMEIAIFAFFLTMDSTNLFFLPSHLNTTIHASFLGYDLMQTSFTKQGIHFTTTLIIIAITSEIVKATIRIVANALNYYDSAATTGDETDKVRTHRIKYAIRKSFGDAKDDTLKFLAFTTFLMFVFLFFPRLKVFSMAVASLTSLGLDLLIPARLKSQRGTDLISRIIDKAFRL